MTQAAEVLCELQRRGVSVAADGDTLCLKPRGALDETLLARVRQVKPAIMEALRTGNTCLHCGGAGRCNCSTCGVMKPLITWTAGNCVACTKLQVQ